jgi:hypothetical protein
MIASGHSLGQRPTSARAASKLLGHALAYAANGLAIIPTKGKKPAFPWKEFQEIPPDKKSLRRMFALGDITGLAVVLGPVSNGIACRDFDKQASYDNWAASHPALVSGLPTSATSRGRHVFFRPAARTRIVNLGDGELRGSGGICLLPPSRHPSGATYEWLIPLPHGELPMVDAVECGLASGAARRESKGQEQHTQARTNSLQFPLPPALPALTLLTVSEKAIRATLPSERGQRRKRVFLLARHLKGITELRDAEAWTLRPVLEEWHKRALPVIGTKDFLETWADFVSAWNEVRVPICEGVVELACNRACVASPPERAVALYGEGSIVLLAALCRELQGLAGDADFFIDCRTAGRLVCIDPSTAWKYLNVLCADRILAAGEKGSLAKRKASRFRFLE